MANSTIHGTDGATVRLSLNGSQLDIEYHFGGRDGQQSTVFLAFGTRPNRGSAVIPYAPDFEGSTVFLPFLADLLYFVRTEREGTAATFHREWQDWRWSERTSAGADFEADIAADKCSFRVPFSAFRSSGKIKLLLYAKEFVSAPKWGVFYGCIDPVADPGPGDKYIPHYYEIDLRAEGGPTAKRRGRLHADRERVRIYQLFVRLFGNTNETRKRNGTLAENGVGRFADINDTALNSLQQMGFTHVWLTGVLQQATATDYSEFGQPGDDTDLLKGLAGSPYAIKDYFDVCPDYAEEPANRLKEFQNLIERLHRHDLKAIIDLVANHVARSYDSCVKPDCNFGACGCEGAGDDRTRFFDPQNNFYYLTAGEQGPPLRLPTCKDGIPMSPTCQTVAALYERRNPETDGGHRPPLQICDGLFEGEKTFGRVTGNNVVSWTPHLNDWYETVKLNYGFDFTDPSKSVREYPNARAPEKAIPDTWKKMDQVIAHWQSMGVDGFRCDMSHMVPPEMWTWVIAQARTREPDVFFIGEAYDDDPAKVPGSDPVVAGLNGGRGNVMFDLLNAGFNAVYDAPVYQALKKIYDGSGWANDIDHAISDDFICHNSIRYAENHDEVRLAARREWGGVGMDVGRPVSAILFGASRGPVMLYNGQEVGEPAEGAEGFGGDDARTTIFDYWSMPEMAKWVSDHSYDGARLSRQQKDLREFYGKLINLVGEPAFHEGLFYGLNRANNQNPGFGRVGDEGAGGHWLYAFLRFDPITEQRFLVIVNLHREITFQDTWVVVPRDAVAFLRLSGEANQELHFAERLEGDFQIVVGTSDLVSKGGVLIPTLAPLTPYFLEIKSV